MVMVSLVYQRIPAGSLVFLYLVIVRLYNKLDALKILQSAVIILSAIVCSVFTVCTVCRKQLLHGNQIYFMEERACNVRVPKLMAVHKGGTTYSNMCINGHFTRVI